MKDKKIEIKKIETFAKKYYNQIPKSEKIWDHVQLVRKFTLKLAEIEGVDKQIVEVASILHDIGKHNGKENHSVESYKLSKTFLENFNLSEDKRKLILKGIFKHSSRFSKEDNELEVKVIQSADGLAILFDRYWQEACRKNIPKEKLLELFDKTKEKINLESAKKIAIPQVKKLKEMLK